MSAHVTCLWGKAPKPGTLPARLEEMVAGRGCRVQRRLPHDERVDPDAVRTDLVVHRGLGAADEPLLAALHEAGVRLCNPWPGTHAVGDRRRWSPLLDRAGLPTSAVTGFDTWAELLLAVDTEVVVKAAAGPGRGETVLSGDAASLPDDPPFAGPFLVEPLLRHDGTDRKLYVAGSSVRGLLKPSTLTTAHVTTGEPFEPGDDLVDLALRVGQAVGVHLYGVDVVLTQAGPVVVDVNAFPGFRGVHGAAELVTDHVLTHL